MENLAWSCGGCNSYKATASAGIDPKTKRVIPLYHPRQNRWNDHFSWSDEGSEVIARTDIGRVTLERLRLNRPEVVSLRKLLLAAGLHPPQDSD